MRPGGRDTAAPRDLLVGDPHEVAGVLLGAHLVSDLRERVELRITEVEAYGDVGADPGSHAHRGRTPRNGSMFGPVGHAYVYFTYGMHWCLNAVAHRPDHAGAVLIRAGEVLDGLDAARARRPAAHRDRDLARGPARLAACLGVTGDVDGSDLLDPQGRLRLLLNPHRQIRRPGSPDVRQVRSGPRTGVAGAGAPTPWRFWLAGEPSVSPYRAAARPPAR